jgi:hypothetical protein
MADLEARLEAANQVADPLADRLVEAFKSLPGGKGWRLLDRALAGEQLDASGEEGVDEALVADLTEIVAPVLAPPDWVDLERVERGAVAYWRAGAINLSLALTCGSLAFG